jgi:phosphoribosylglycinamide formyltransferase-1
LNAIDEAHAHGVKVTGVTVHIVDESQDGGPIVLQEPVPVLEADSVQDLAERIHTVEHRLLPEAVRLFAENRVRVVGRRVEIHDAPVAVPT